MAKSVWTSKEKKRETRREKNLSAFRAWMDHKLIDADVSEKSLAKEINRSPRMFSQYKATGKWPFEQMAVLLGLLDATDEEIVQVVKWWQ